MLLRSGNVKCGTVLAGLAECVSALGTNKGPSSRPDELGPASARGFGEPER